MVGDKDIAPRSRRNAARRVESGARRGAGHDVGNLLHAREERKVAVCAEDVHDVVRERGKENAARRVDVQANNVGNGSGEGRPVGRGTRHD